ncbi:LysO family transporter [Tistrella mobilis]|uniref:DUF340 domain-containing protein n=1 Tax=Tistrella mobilis TaxID=171437 RepID=A0A162LDQ2_9PROT|nr:LysO family transporter [Tistrella mobilis]KYO54496.1 hypothetical protein AUP44_25055 [Tistrella mobilis]
MLALALAFLAGLVLGRLLRGHRTRIARPVDRLTTVSIVVLLVLMGIGTGAMPDLAATLAASGLKAVTISAAAVAGSILVTLLLLGLIGRTRRRPLP